MLEMIFPRLTVDEDAIKNNKDKGPEIRIENFIHENLEGGRCITKSKWLNKKLIVAYETLF